MAARDESHGLRRAVGAIAVSRLRHGLVVAFVCVVGFASCILLGSSAALAQSGAARIEAPAVVLGAPASELSLDIVLKASDLPPNSYVRIRGLAPQMALTDGHAIAPGSWAVSIAALPDLRVIVPAGVSGKNDVSIALVAIDGGVVAEAHTTLIVAAAAMPMATVPRDPAPPAPVMAAPVMPEAPAAAPPSVTAPPQQPQRTLPPRLAAPVAPPAPALPPAVPAPQAAPSPPVLSAAERDRAFGFVTRGNALLLEGNIVSARLFFTRAANAGLADGALAMGETFDPNELARLRAIGVQPDVAEARRWYERARALGASAEADKHLTKLGR